MKSPWLESLAVRFFLVAAFATVLPLLLVLAFVLGQVYDATARQTFATIEQTSRLYAAEFSAQLNQTLAQMEAVASFQDENGAQDASLARRLLALNPQLKRAWFRREGALSAQESGGPRALYEAVKFHQSDALSEPDFDANEASVGHPLFRDGLFVGMVAVTFPLTSFQATVSRVHILETGYSLLVSHGGYRIAHPDPKLIGVRIGNDLPHEKATELLGQVAQGRAFSFGKRALATGKWSQQYYAPVTVGGAREPWFFVTVAPTGEATKELDLLFLQVFVGTLAALLLVGGATWAATRSVVRPLKELAEGAAAIAEGHWDRRIPWTSRDEVGVVAKAVNHMTDQLVEALKDREEEVHRRTASLEASLRDLEAAQAKIVESEKLAVLGRLMATLAHEINTPLGAIRSSASSVLQRASAWVSELPEFHRILDADALSLYQRLTAGISAGRSSTPSDDRRRRRALAVVLAEAGVNDAESLAEDIVQLVGPNDEAAVVEHAVAGRGPIIRQASQTLSLYQSSVIIQEAADRAASTVTALVEYSRAETYRHDSVVYPEADIETLLTLSLGAAKKGVVVVRRFEQGLAFQGDRDRLNQVWANLIHNAVQALDGHGVLQVETRSVANRVEIRFGNDGPAIPPEIGDKIFLPFFTTKKAGEGTGLGLGICRRIVEAHGGTLTCRQEGGLTVFCVSLPLSQS